MKQHSRGGSRIRLVATRYGRCCRDVPFPRGRFLGIPFRSVPTTTRASIKITEPEDMLSRLSVLLCLHLAVQECPHHRGLLRHLHRLPSQV